MKRRPFVLPGSRTSARSARAAPLVALLLSPVPGGCSPAGDALESGGDEEAASPTPSAPLAAIVVDHLDAGVVLSAWSGGGRLWMVGGKIQGRGPGFLASLQDDVLCVEENISANALWWIHGAGEDAFFLVGEKGTILRVSGEGIEDESVDTESTLYGVWDLGQGRAWAVGGDPQAGLGEIWRREGGEWTIFRRDLPGTIFKIWCANSTQCLFAGDDYAYFYDNDTLTETITGEHLLTCRGRAWDDIWCVGGYGASLILRWDGAQWNNVPTAGLGQPLMGIWLNDDEGPWVSGRSGITALYADGQWKSDMPLVTEDFHAVWKYGDVIYFVGGNLTSSGDDYHGTIQRFGESAQSEVDIACPE